MSLIQDYFLARNNYEACMDTLEKVAIEDVVADELSRIENIKNRGITIINYSVILRDYELDDKRVFVDIDETITFEYNGVISQETIDHKIKLDRGSCAVVSDGYQENFSGFTSCSYVPEEYRVESIQPYIVSRETRVANPSNGCIIEIALAENGYVEKKDNNNLNDKTANPGSGNWTKYNAYFGLGQAEWCYSFISWCARQAGISTTICPTQFSTKAGMDYYVAADRFGYRGKYVPTPGDIIFFYAGTKDGHVGLVVDVSGNIVSTIEGNCGQKVAMQSYSLTDSSITGYGMHEEYAHSVGWTISTLTHEKSCACCNAVFVEEDTHDYVAYGTKYRCTVCGNVTVALPEVVSAIGTDPCN